MTDFLCFVDQDGNFMGLYEGDAALKTLPAGAVQVDTYPPDGRHLWQNGAWIAPPPSWSSYQAQAQTLLDKADLVALRCFKKGVAFPSDWQAYDDALRAIVSAATGDPSKAMPAQPAAYPPGT